jgi:hypothetical protein
MKKLQPIKVSDIVMYSAHFLRSIGVHAGDICFARGQCTYLQKFGRFELAGVVWNTPKLRNELNSANLIGIDQRAIESV